MNQFETTNDVLDALECGILSTDVDDRETWNRITNGRLQGFSVSPSIEDFAVDLADLSLQTPAMDRIIEREQQRTERAIRGAIRAGYDGVDINRPDSCSVGIESIEPWNRPEPSTRGVWTERYTWDWFSDDELTRLLTDDSFIRELEEDLHRC